MSSNNRKCIKNMQHEWDTVAEHPSHIVKECWRCRAKRYIARNNGIRISRFVPTRC